MPAWGVVQTGQVTLRWVDHEETYGAGDAYYAGPGHRPPVSAGTSLVEFSPTDSQHLLARTDLVADSGVRFRS